MTNRVFPIQNQSACLLKWAWSTIYFNSGTSASCHRTQKYVIPADNFDSFHNLPDKLVARHTMLAGMWPQAGCEYCKNVEDAGGVSDRQSTLQEDTGWLVPPELDNNVVVDVTPTILEVYFKNTCNMKCVYCGPHHSSLWEEENRKFDDSFHNRVFDIKQAQHNDNYDQMVAGLWKYLDANDRYKTIKRYHILGGEPFLMSELDDSIEFWRSHPNPDLIFSVITNLNIPTARFERYLGQFKKLVLSNKIWKLQITASLDCWDKEQEYVRYGLDLAQWQHNFELLLNQPWISVSINSAISALTIKSLPKLLERINKWNTQQTATATWFQRDWAAEPIIHSFNTSAEFDNPYLFDGAVFAKDFERILELMPNITPTQQAQRRAMQGIATTSLACKNNVEQIDKLKTYLTTLDQRRNTNWPSHFAWLNKDFSVQ
jgi:organic radical activating enzyme